MYKFLNVQHLSVLDLIDPAEVNKRASILPPSEDEFDNVVVADSHIAASEAVGMSMHPRTMPGAVLLLDRHYNSMTPYRKGENNMYAVRKDGKCTIKYVETL